MLIQFCMYATATPDGDIRTMYRSPSPIISKPVPLSSKSDRRHAAMANLVRGFPLTLAGYPVRDASCTRPSGVMNTSPLPDRLQAGQRPPSRDTLTGEPESSDCTYTSALPVSSDA